jgi:SAM-dependent methyltransferase
VKDRRAAARWTEELPAIYARRFSDADAPRKGEVWREITRFLQRWIDPSSTVVDLACDRGAFINVVEARRRIAVDVRDVRRHLDPGVEFLQVDGLSLVDCLPAGSVDVVFMSNYLEHLASADAVIDQFKVVAALLRPGGRVIVLQPNIRLTGGSYWDFLDHKTALTEKSLEEAARMADLEVEEMIIRFLPYTTKSRFPQSPWLVRAYLWFRPAWLALGRQTLLVARRPVEVP